MVTDFNDCEHYFIYLLIYLLLARRQQNIHPDTLNGADDGHHAEHSVCEQVHSRNLQSFSVQRSDQS